MSAAARVFCQPATTTKLSTRRNKIPTTTLKSHFVFLMGNLLSVLWDGSAEFYHKNTSREQLFETQKGTNSTAFYNPFQRSGAAAENPL